MRTKKRDALNKLNEYFDIMQHKINEPKTSHIFLCYLNLVSGIPLYLLIPQGTCTHGAIDFVYLHPKNKAIFIFELKRVGKLDRYKKKLTSQEIKYLKNPINDINKFLGKEEIKDIENDKFLLTTDLKNTYLSYRIKVPIIPQKKSYYFIIYESDKIQHLFNALKKDLNQNSYTKLKKRILIDDEENFKNIILEILLKRKPDKNFVPLKLYCEYINPRGHIVQSIKDGYKKSIKRCLSKKLETLSIQEKNAIKFVLRHSKTKKLISEIFYENIGLSIPKKYFNSFYKSISI